MTSVQSGGKWTWYHAPRRYTYWMLVMTSKKVFEDGCSIEWKDKETLIYREGERSTCVSVDFEPGWFKSGRIVKAGSIEDWDEPGKEGSKISEEKREEIIKKIIIYYQNYGKSVVID